MIRAVVLMTRLRLTAPPALIFAIGFVPMKLHVPGLGNPELQLSDIAVGIAPVALTVIWKVAGAPATTVAVAGATESVKSFTLAETGAVALKVWLRPKTLTVPLSPNTPAVLGVIVTVTRAD